MADTDKTLFVGRKDGSIYGTWTVRQWDGQEELPETHPDLVAFLAPKAQPKVLTLEGVVEALKAKGHLSDADIEDAKK